MQDASGNATINFAFGSITNPIDYYVTEIDSYYNDGTLLSPAISPDVSFPPSIGSNLKTPTHLLAIDFTTNVAAYDVNPAGPSKTQYIAGNKDTLITIYSVKAGSTTRIAWVNATSGKGSAIDWVNDSGSGTPTLNGPLSCSSGCTSIVHAVPDPTAQDAFFLLCDAAMYNQRAVVRLKTDGSCGSVLEGSTLPDRFELERLAIGQ
jgi:hypothetical protein